MKHELDIYSI